MKKNFRNTVILSEPYNGTCEICQQLVFLEYLPLDQARDVCEECAGHLERAEIQLRRAGMDAPNSTLKPNSDGQIELLNLNIYPWLR